MWPVTGTARENVADPHKGLHPSGSYFSHLFTLICGPDFSIFHPTSATDLVTANYWVILEKPVVGQPLKRFPLFYGIRQVHHHVHKIPPLFSIRSQANLVYTHILFFWVCFNIISPATSRFSLWSLLSTYFCLFHLAAVVQLFTKFQPLYATDDSEPCWLEPTTVPHPEPDETSPHRYIMYLWDAF
jgi:hypothetical protein